MTSSICILRYVTSKVKECVHVQERHGIVHIQKKDRIVNVRKKDIELFMCKENNEVIHP